MIRYTYFSQKIYPVVFLKTHYFLCIYNHFLLIYIRTCLIFVNLLHVSPFSDLASNRTPTELMQLLLSLKVSNKVGIDSA